MKELFTCANCGDCAVKLGFGFTFPDTYICTQRGDEVAPDDGSDFYAAERPRYCEVLD